MALVLIEWTAGWIAASAWSQSWAVIKRGHFRIIAWCTAVFAALAWLANGTAIEGVADVGVQRAALVGLAVAAVAYLAVQYSRTHLPGVVVGVIASVAGVVTLVASAGLLPEWPTILAAAQLLAGMALLGAVTNGMLLGHWYLNQPGLKPWALARLTDLTLASVVASAVVGLIAAPRLSTASTEGAVLGLPGFGDSFSLAFYLVWLGLIAFTGAVVWGARRCVQIRSIQSATGLYYVALLSAGVSEFLVRYLMVNAT